MYIYMGFPGDLDGKETAYNVRYLDSTPEWGRPSGEGNDNPLQYSCLKNSMDRRAWQATILWAHKEPDATERLTL